MNRVKALIVDDEPQAHVILENYISRIPELHLVHSVANALEAKSYLGIMPVDLMLLDINMPSLDGFGLLDQLTKPPLIIFTTAYSEFGVKSYDYNAIDYLIKPIRFERFKKAISKALDVIKSRGNEETESIHDLTIKVDGELVTVPFDQITCIQSLGNYIKVITREKTLIATSTTHDIESTLPRSVFLRVHKSFIINITKVTSVNTESLLVDSRKIPIGQTYKRYVSDFLKT